MVVKLPFMMLSKSKMLRTVQVHPAYLKTIYIHLTIGDNFGNSQTDIRINVILREKWSLRAGCPFGWQAARESREAVFPVPGFQHY
jgi:hypothetical protein